MSMSNEVRIRLQEDLAEIAVAKMTSAEKYNFLFAAHFDYLDAMPQRDLEEIADQWFELEDE